MDDCNPAIQQARNDRMWERQIERSLTCKSDDVQRYAIHGSQNIRRHAVGMGYCEFETAKHHTSVGA